MNLSARLKKWLVDENFVKATATDDEFRAGAGKAISEGKLTTEKLVELTSKEADKEANAFQETLKAIGSAIGELKTVLLEEKNSTTEEEEEEVEGGKSVDGKKRKPSKEEETAEGEELDENGKPKKKAKPDGKKHVPSTLEKMVTRMGGFSDEDDEKEFNVRVKEAAEQYSSTKTALTYPTHTTKGKSHHLAGRPVMDFSEPGMGRGMDLPSDLDKAVAGAFGKFIVSAAVKKSKTLAFMSLPQHDKELLSYAMENMKWGGSSDGGNLADIKDRKLTPHEQKEIGRAHV